MSQIRLVRLGGTPDWSHGQALAENRHCRLDPSSKQHGASVDGQGVLHYFHIDTARRATTELLPFQLQLRASDDEQFEPIRQPWAFEFVPGLPGEIMLVQSGSCRILYASLPRQSSDASDVFLFGSHAAHVTCICTNGSIAVSGCSGGTLKLWRMADGQLSDSAVVQGGAAVTVIECIGPLMVAAGTAAGSVTLYDTASGRLLAVQRLLASHGPVSCMAAWLDPALLSRASLAVPGPRIPDGGGVLPGPNIGMPWRGLAGAEGSDVAPDASGSSPPAALLAVAGPSGWLGVYRASLPGPNSWHLLHSNSSSSGTPLAGPITAVAFSPAGDTLAVAGPAAQILGTDATAIAAAGGAPGAVSLYSISSSNNGYQGGAGAAVSQGQQRELQLWQQWCLRSLAISLLVLPSSGVQLTAGQEVGAVQVLSLLAMPELGSSLVLTASRPLHNSTEQEQKRQQQQQQQQPGSTQGSPQRQQVAPAAAAAAAAVVSPVRIGNVDGYQQPGPAAAGVSPAAARVDTAASAADVLNIAEGDLSDLAAAIAEADALPDSHLEQLLDSLVAEATAALEDQVIGSQAAAAAAVAAAGGSGDRVAQAEGVYSAESVETSVIDPQAASLTGHANELHTASQQPQQWKEAAPAPTASAEQPAGVLAAVGARRHLLFDSSNMQTEGKVAHPISAIAAAAAATGVTVESAAPNSSSAAAAGHQPEGDAESRPWLRRPTTLPTLRSWMDRAAVLAAGTAAEAAAAAVDLRALAEEMQQQRRQVAQGEAVEQQAAAAQPGCEGALPPGGQFGEGQQQQQQQQQQDSGEQELPCESSFQELQDPHRQLQQQAGEHIDEALAAGPAVETVARDIKDEAPAAAAAATQLTSSTTQFAPQQQQHLGSCASAGVPAGAQTAAIGAGDDEAEPQPRQLPIALQRPHSSAGKPAAQQPQQQQGAGVVGAADSPASAGTAAAAVGRLGMPQPFQRPAAAWVPGAVHVTRAGAVEEAVEEDHQRQQQQQQEGDVVEQWVQQQGQPLQATQLPEADRQQLPPTGRQQQAQQQAGQARPLGVRERLSLRRAQVLQDKGRENVQAASSSEQTAAAAAAAAAGIMPLSDHPLATAVANSSRLLERKIQEAEQVPQVVVDPAAPAVMQLAAKLSELDVDFDQQLYEDLTDIKDIPTPRHAQKLVPKQLDARWIASRSLKPELSVLFRPEEWQPGCVQPQVLLLPNWPTPQQVVQQLLWPQRG